MVVLVGLLGCGRPNLPQQGGSKTAGGSTTSDGGPKDDDKTPIVHDEKAVEVIDAAIKAHGGAEALARAKVVESVAKGKEFANNNKVTVELESIDYGVRPGPTSLLRRPN